MNILVPDAQCPLSGIETINLRLLPELARLGHRVIWAVPEHRLPALRSKSAEYPGFELVPIEWPKASPMRWIAALVRRLEKSQSSESPDNHWGRLRQRLQQRRLQNLARKHAIQQLLYTWTLGEPVPELDIPVSALVHDLNWHRFPENFSGITPQKLDTLTLMWIQRAKKIFTFSRTVRDELAIFAPQYSAKYSPVLLATQIPAERLVQIATQAGLHTGRTVFYYPATVSAHKNHLTLLRAAAAVAKSGLDFELVLSGSGTQAVLGDTPLSGFAEEIRKAFQASSDMLAGKVRALGYVSREELDAEFARADCMVLPSLFEGFGLPLTEGLGWGKQIICSNIAPYDEQITHHQATGWVRVFNAHSADDLAAHMRQVIIGPRPSPAASAEIARNVSRWSWTEVAEAYAHGLL